MFISGQREPCGLDVISCYSLQRKTRRSITAQSDFSINKAARQIENFHRPRPQPGLRVDVTTTDTSRDSPRKALARITVRLSPDHPGVSADTQMPDAALSATTAVKAQGAADKRTHRFQAGGPSTRSAGEKPGCWSAQRRSQRQRWLSGGGCSVFPRRWAN